MPLTRPDLVLIDLDGTLVDSAPDLAFSVNAMLQALNLPVHTEAAVRDWIGSGAERLVKRALMAALDTKNDEPPQELFDQAFASFTDYYLQNTCRSSCLFPGVREGMDYLLQTGRKLGVVTNKRHRFTVPLLQGLGVYDDFVVVISGDTLAVKKPDPQPLLHAAAQVNVPVEKTVMIGDSINDVEAARAAGMAVLCVRNGYNNGDDIESCRPDVILDNFADLKSHI